MGLELEPRSMSERGMSDSVVEARSSARGGMFAQFRGVLQRVMSMRRGMCGACYGESVIDAGRSECIVRAN